MQMPSVVPTNAFEVASIPVHPSPASLTAIQNLIYAIVARLALGVINSLWSLFFLWKSPLSYLRPGIGATLISFLLYHVPDVLLIIYLQRKPDRRTFAFALAVPAVLIIQTLYTFPLLFSYYSHSLGGLLFGLMFFGLECLILWLTWQANERLGLRHELASLLVAGVATFLYFGFVRHSAVPLSYRFWR